MSRTLPERASLEWLRKTAKQQLRKQRENNPEARLSDAQLALARDYGFSSWRALKAAIEDRPAGAAAEDEAAALLRDIAEGNIERVLATLRAKPSLVNEAGPHPYWGGRPQPLHVAIERGHRPIFGLLVTAGADIDGRSADYDGWSPLMLAAGDDKADLRTTLMACGAHVGLTEALLMRDDAAVARLAEAGLPERVPNGGSILAFARTPFAIDRLIALGAPTDLADRWGATPVQSLAAVRPDGSALVLHLARHGVVADAKSAARLGDAGALQAVAAADPDVLRRPDVLIAAVTSGTRALVAWLLDQGADVNVRSENRSRHTPLHEAVWIGDLAMAKLLVERGAALDVRDAEHDSLPWGWADTSFRITRNRKCREVADWLASLPEHPPLKKRTATVYISGSRAP